MRWVEKLIKDHKRRWDGYKKDEERQPKNPLREFKSFSCQPTRPVLLFMKVLHRFDDSALTS